MQPKTIEIIHVRNLERTKRFYEALGFALQQEQHGESLPLHYSVDFGGYLWEFYPTKNTGVATQPSKDRRLIVETEDLKMILRICDELGLRHEPVKLYDAERGLHTFSTLDPDGWLVHIREAAPSVH